MDCPESVLDSFSDSASDSFCETEHLVNGLFSLYTNNNNNTGNEVLSEPL